jgi:hypothetical protein
LDLIKKVKLQTHTLELGFPTDGDLAAFLALNEQATELWNLEFDLAAAEFAFCKNSFLRVQLIFFSYEFVLPQVK